jgi:hypothetical protein
MFEINPSFGTTKEWEDILDSDSLDGKLKFPVTFFEDIPPIKEIENQLTLSPPKRKDKIVKTVTLGKKSKKDKNSLF